MVIENLGGYVIYIMKNFQEIGHTVNLTSRNIQRKDFRGSPPSFFFHFHQQQQLGYPYFEKSRSLVTRPCVYYLCGGSCP